MRSAARSSRSPVPRSRCSPIPTRVRSGAAPRTAQLRLRGAALHAICGVQAGRNASRGVESRVSAVSPVPAPLPRSRVPAPPTAARGARAAAVRRMRSRFTTYRAGLGRSPYVHKRDHRRQRRSTPRSSARRCARRPQARRLGTAQIHGIVGRGGGAVRRPRAECSPPSGSASSAVERLGALDRGAYLQFLGVFGTSPTPRSLRSWPGAGRGPRTPLFPGPRRGRFRPGTTQAWLVHLQSRDEERLRWLRPPPRPQESDGRA